MVVVTHVARQCRNNRLHALKLYILEIPLIQFENTLTLKPNYKSRGWTDGAGLGSGSYQSSSFTGDFEQNEPSIMNTWRWEFWVTVKCKHSFINGMFVTATAVSGGRKLGNTDICWWEEGKRQKHSVSSSEVKKKITFVWLHKKLNQNRV